MNTAQQEAYDNTKHTTYVVAIRRCCGHAVFAAADTPDVFDESAKVELATLEREGCRVERMTVEQVRAVEFGCRCAPDLLAENERLKAEIRRLTDYPDDTEGARLARQTRESANKLTPEEREHYLKVAMDRINASPTKDEQIATLRAALKELVEALKQIAEGRGAFSHDPLQHASNVIEENKRTARAALSRAKEAVK